MRVLFHILIVAPLLLADGFAQRARPITQNPPPIDAPPAPPVLAPESDVLKRMKAAAGDERAAHADLVLECTVTLETSEGPVVVPVRITRTSNGGQHLRFNQSDGKPWDGTIPHLEPNTRRILEFLQTQHDRALPHVADAAARNATIIDAGTKDGTQQLAVHEATGASTQYTLDAKTAVIGRVEFERPRVEAGKTVPARDAYVYSDVRMNAGIATAYHVEHYTNGAKQEALTVTSVRTIPINPALARRGGRP